MIIVSDTSPITNLMQIEQLDLLHQLYGRVLIPAEVHDELCHIPAQAVILAKEAWIERVELALTALMPGLLETLDLGEAEAISLAIQLEAEYLLVDEQKGRQAARNKGIPITGTLGVLLQAKQQALIPQLRPYMDRLIREAGFRVKKDLYAYLIQLSGE